MARHNPLTSMHLTSGFRTKLRPTHNGADYRASIGTVVRAAEAGEARPYTGTSGGGRVVEITHKDGSKAYYSHLSEQLVTRGQKVAAGDIIGKSGNTGNTTGPHLHLGVMRGGQWIDPEKWLAEASSEAPKPAAVKKRTTSDYLTRAEIKNLQAGLRKKYPAYRWWVKSKRGRLLSVDGVDGPQTQAWVAEFQKRTGLKVDGIADPKTIAEAERRGINI